ncbi:uncharacterized protein LOC106654938 isoform X4 [Trichogramma pretiosum]|uniref:uncharacterized protein LOC106654938 isoform X4 n=1 Tax=Trichogramma pretiosum TaxID=7493 RepID=UPI0006C96B37|nr:uncharacterized protein LOC106654938 isoform X4 [Trichogramma pretiosum]
MGLKLIPNLRTHPSLVYNNYLFTMSTCYRDYVVWRCVAYGFQCTCRVYTSSKTEDGIVITVKNENHVQDVCEYLANHSLNNSNESTTASTSSNTRASPLQNQRRRNEFAGSSSSTADVEETIRQASRAESPLAAGSPAESAAASNNSATTAAAAAVAAAATVASTASSHVVTAPVAATATTTVASTASSSSSSSSSNLACDKEIIGSGAGGESSSQSHHSRQQQIQSDEAAALTTAMRRTPPQSRSSSDRQTIGQQQSQQQQQGSTNGGRVTLRLNPMRQSARDDNKKSSATSAQQQSSSTATPSQQQQQQRISTSNAAAVSISSTSTSHNSKEMETVSSSSSTTKSSNASAAPAALAKGNTSSSSSSADASDVYEFKSSKEATPVRGSSTSPNPNPNEKDAKDSNIASASVSTSSNPAGSTSSTGQSQSSGANVGNTSLGLTNSNSSATSTTITSTVSAAGSSSTTSSLITVSNPSADSMTSSTSSAMQIDENVLSSTASPSSSIAPSSNKRSYENDPVSTDDQDEETRKRKKKDDTGKETSTVKGAAGRNQTVNRNNPAVNEKKRATSTNNMNNPISKPNQASTTFGSGDHRSPSSFTANSPKSSLVNMTPESDGEDDKSKNADNGCGPKVPPLKIVIPQSTTSEQEQGNRNGKNTSNRSHQLPYVVATSNSNDSTDKELSNAGSPMDTSSNAGLKGDEKKDFSGVLDESRSSIHHQRVLRSSHKAGNDSLGTTIKNSNSAATGSNSTDKSDKSVEMKKEPIDSSEVTIKKEPGEAGANVQTSVELHPRKRKMKTNKEAQQANTAAAVAAAASDIAEAASTGSEVHPHDQPITNCIQLFINIRKQIERRRKSLFPVQPKPPSGFKDYLMNRCTYVLARNTKEEPTVTIPASVPAAMKDLYTQQEQERYDLRMAHVVEKEKLVLAVEQEILRVHGRAARALANQSRPFSLCTILKDEEVYNVITPEQEEKDRNARSRYNGRLFLSWLQDVDDKWEKIKEGMLLRHHQEADSLHAIQKLDWEWKLKEVGLCEAKGKPQIDETHVPNVPVSDDFDLLPA